MGKQRLLFISPVAPKLTGNGGQIRTATQLLALATIFEITLAIMAPPASEAEPLANVSNDILGACAETMVVWDEPLLDRVRRKVPQGQAWAAIWAAWPTPQLFARTTAAIRKLPMRLSGQHFDVVHCVQLRTARAIAALPRAGVTWSRAVIDVDNYESETFASYARFLGPTHGRQYALLHRLEAMKWHRIEASYLPRFNDGYVCSANDRARLQQRFPTVRWTVMPNVGPGPAALAARPHPCFTFVFIGTLDYPPNEDAVRFFCQDVMPRLRQMAQIPFRLVIAGRRPSPELQRLAAQDDVEVVADPPSVAPFYAEADVALAPIRFGGGSRIKILEAFSNGLPVVATSFGAVGIDGEPGRDFLVGDDAQGFAEQCQRMMIDPVLRKRVGLAGMDLFRSKYSAHVLPAIFQATFGAEFSEPGTRLSKSA